MFRRTIEITPKANIATDLGRHAGVELIEFDPRLCKEYCGQGGTNGPQEGAKERPIYEPHIISVSACVRSNPPTPPLGPASSDTDIELTAMLWSWYEKERTDPAIQAGANAQTTYLSALLNSCKRQFLAGWWTGDAGRREFFAPNFGEGYEVPRAIVPASKCQDFQNWWVLALYWNFDFASFASKIVVDYEWRERGL